MPSSSRDFNSASRRARFSLMTDWSAAPPFHRRRPQLAHLVRLHPESSPLEGKVVFLFDFREVVDVVWKHLDVVQVTQVLGASEIFGSFLRGFALSFFVRFFTSLQQTCDLIVARTRAGVDRRLGTTLLLLDDLSPREKIILDALLRVASASAFILSTRSCFHLR